MRPIPVIWANQEAAAQNVDMEMFRQAWTNHMVKAAVLKQDEDQLLARMHGVKEPNPDEWYGEQLHHLADFPVRHDSDELGTIQLPPEYEVKKQDLDATFTFPSEEQKGKQ